MRISLALGDQRFEYMLYDHIPHWDNPDEKNYKFQVTLPDINCQDCALVRRDGRDMMDRPRQSTSLIPRLLRSKS
jgi:hypothetical protein